MTHFIVKQRTNRTGLFDVIDTKLGYAVKSFFTEAKAQAAADMRNALPVLTRNQDDAMQSLANYVGQTIEVLTSEYYANVSPAYVARAKGVFNSSTLRGLETKGFIRIEDAYWKGATITVLKDVAA